MYFDFSKLKKIKVDLEKEMGKVNFWDESAEAQKTIQKLNQIKNKLKLITDLEEKLEEVNVLIELMAEEGDETLFQDELKENVKTLEKDLAQAELKIRLNGDYDVNNAILTIHPGAGGTESQDWAQMLLRMYTRWAENNGFQVKTLDFMAGEEAGVKRVTLLIKGDYCYGYLKGERGVHRLVRISPFDSSGRRHTSFASVAILPELNEEIEIDIDDTDLKIETYRASGAGGQHVNKTDSAVRITHLPTGQVVQCQNERSQHKNKKMAMLILTARLLEMKEEAQADKIEEIQGEHKEIAWGSQIRSYVFHPYNMIKDHRTGLEEGNVQKVMDGYLDEFIDAYLSKGKR